jgi:hypothetical protein
MGSKSGPPQFVLDFYKYDPSAKVLFKHTNLKAEGVLMEELLEAFPKVGINLQRRNHVNLQLLIEQTSGYISWTRLIEFTVQFGPLLLCNENIDEFIRDDAKKWYHGYTDLEKANEILTAEYKKNPTEEKTIYLVRAHRKPTFYRDRATRLDKLNYCHAFTLTAIRGPQSVVKHYMIYRNMKGYMVFTGGPTNPTFFPSFTYIFEFFKIYADSSKPVTNSKYDQLYPNVSQNKTNDEKKFLPEYTSITSKKLVEGTIDYLLSKKDLTITNSSSLISFAKDHQLPSEDSFSNGWFLLGTGANSKVFLAEFKGELVAAKRLTSLTFNEDRLREVRQLSHMNIVKILDLIEVEEKGKPNTKQRHLVMELMETDLFCHISKNEKTPTLFWHSEGMQYAIDIISGLEYLHSRSLIHKDIKSANIFLKLISKPTDYPDQYMFVARMTAKIGDLDNMRKEDKDNPYLLNPSAHTPQYASPEQFKDSKNLTTASDIYSFGVLLWELATKQRPWQSSGGMEVLKETTSGNFLNAHKKFLDDKTDLLNVISKCCELDPKNRPSATTIKEMIFKLPPYLNV